ncbi:hypothetical protein EI94DRAFT_1518084, partial [Lactarius quietus]
IPLDVIACVTFYTKSQSSSKGKNAKTVTTKETRAKDFTFVFAPTQTNYIAFLQAILEKHHLTKYKVSDQVVFPCNMQVPPAKVCHVIWPLCIKSNAMYVINFNEYKGLANKILKKSPSRPITVFIEMPDIERVQKRTRNGLFLPSDGEEGDGIGEQDEDSDADKNSLGLTRIDYELAHFCQMLEKKYATDHDSTYSYNDPATATTILLTPFMMKEWAQAMVHCSCNIAMVNNPLHTISFNPANCKSLLGTQDHTQSSVSS